MNLLSVFLTGIGILSVLFIGYQISNTNYNSSSTPVCAKDGTKEEIGQIVPLLRQIIEAQHRQEQKKQDPRVDELLQEILNATKLLHYVPPREDIEFSRTDSTKKKYTTLKGQQQDPAAFSSSPTSPPSFGNCLGWKQTIDCNGRAWIDRDSLANYVANLSLIPNDQLFALPYYAKTCHDQIPTQASGFCECKNKKKHYYSCGHAPFMCKDVCSGLLSHTMPECLQSLMNFELPDVEKFILEKNKTEETEETETEEEEEIDLNTTIPPSPFCSSFHKKNISHTFLYNYTQIFNSRYFFAINLKSNKPIIYHFLHELIRTLLLFPNRQQLFVSIVESNSADSTPTVLGEFDKILDVLDIPHRIIVHHPLRMGHHRIEFLAQVRNAVLEPLYSSPNHTYDKLIFLNDVIFCQEDIFRLLSHEGHNDIICATDWILNHEQRLGIYDLWVTRSISGDMLLNWLDFPYFSEPRSQERMKQGQTIPILSCWNGIIIATTKPIYENNVRFRRNQPAPVDECNWSECGLFCLDYIKAGYSHILIDPQVQVGYTIDQSCRIFSDDKIPFNTDLSPPPWEDFILSDKFVCEPMREGGVKKAPYWQRYLFPPDMNLTERNRREPFHPGTDRRLPLIT